MACTSPKSSERPASLLITPTGTPRITGPGDLMRRPGWRGRGEGRGGPRGGSSRIGSSLWSSSQIWLRGAYGRVRYTSAARRPCSPVVQYARSAGVSCSANARCNVRSATGRACTQPATRKSGTGTPAACVRPDTTAERARATAVTLPRKRAYASRSACDSWYSSGRCGRPCPPRVSHRQTVRSSTPSPFAASRTCSVVSDPAARSPASRATVARRRCEST
jgi:hypothetical protein